MSVKINNNCFMMGAMYTPFCRTICPPYEEWPQDISNMMNLGFNCLHGFCEWHDIEYEKGRFDFSKVDRLIELSVNNEIMPIINIATHNGVGYYSPRWLMQEYKGGGFATSEGFCDPQDSTYKFPCLDDPWYQAYANRYLGEIAKHYMNDNRIGGWVIWGEPALSFGGKPVCYCPYTISKFRQWLLKKYQTISQLNEMWGTDGPSEYCDFSQINPPRGSAAHLGSYPSWQDWRTFMDENLVEHIYNAGVTLKNGGAKQPTIAELFCDFGRFSAASIDVWKLAEAADIVGISDFERPGFKNAKMMMLADSISKGSNKSFFVVEALGGPKFNTSHTLGVFHTPCDEEIVAEAAQIAGNSAKGLMYWCYRPRLSDKEAGEFGLVAANGNILSRAEASGEFSQKLIQKGQDLIDAYRKSSVAIFESTEIQHLALTDSVLDLYNQAVDGAAKLCIYNHVNADFINPSLILKGKLKEYSVLLLPFAYMIDENVINMIAEFVHDGGTVIADYPIGMKNSKGIAYINLPGGKFREVFGFERYDVLYLDHESRIKTNSFNICTGKFIDMIKLNQANAEDYFGSFPLVCINEYGKGIARYMGFQFFSEYTEKNLESLKSFFLTAGVEPHVSIHGEKIDESKIFTSCLNKKDEHEILTLLHADYGCVNFNCIFNENVNVFDYLSGKIIDAKHEKENTIINVTLGDWGYIMIEKINKKP